MGQVKLQRNTDFCSTLWSKKYSGNTPHEPKCFYYALAARRAESGILVSACRLSSSFVPLPFFLQIIPITVSFYWLESVQTLLVKILQFFVHF